MPDEQPQTPPGQTPAKSPKVNPNISPAPTEAVESSDHPAEQPAQTDASKTAALPDDPLPDGTKPTVLTPGSKEVHGDIKTGRANLKTLYQRADVMTTLLTFIGLIVAASLVLGGYFYVTRSKAGPATAPKLTTLDKAELEKLGAFFTSNSTGDTAQILTISSSSLFKNRVGITSDLKVTGGLGVEGPTALGSLTVDKTSTLSVTNIRGQLTVAGPTTLQSPAILAAGASITGNLTTSGNGSFGGSLSAGLLNVRDLSVSGTLNLAGHLAITGQAPSVSPAGDSGGGSASVDGNDSAGTVTINTGAVSAATTANGGLLVTITFRTPYAKTPHIVITPVGAGSARITPYVQKTATSFTIGTTGGAKATTSYSFDYWIVQ